MGLVAGWGDSRPSERGAPIGQRALAAAQGGVRAGAVIEPPDQALNIQLARRLRHAATVADPQGRAREVGEGQAVQTPVVAGDAVHILHQEPGCPAVLDDAARWVEPGALQLLGCGLHLGDDRHHR